MTSSRAQVLHFGSVALMKMECPICGYESLVIDGRCGHCSSELGKHEPVTHKRISEGHHKRRCLSLKEKSSILASQNDKCFYCFREFDSVNRPHFDHILPFAHYGDEQIDNFAAACRFCNSWKNNKVFRSVAEIRAYVLGEWNKKLPKSAVQQVIQSKKAEPEILQQEMPIRPSQSGIRENTGSRIRTIKGENGNHFFSRVRTPPSQSRKCRICEKEYIGPSNSFYCSWDCASVAKKPKGQISSGKQSFSAICAYCGKAFTSSRAGQKFDKNHCRFLYWRRERDRQLRAEIITRHMASMKAELEAHKLHPFGCPCLEH